MSGLWRANPPFGYNSGSESPVKSLGSFGYNSGSESAPSSGGGMRRRFDHVGAGVVSDDDGDGVTDSVRTAGGSVYTRTAPVPVLAGSVGGGGDLAKWLGYAAVAVVAVLVVKKVKRLRKRKARAGGAA